MRIARACCSDGGPTILDSSGGTGPPDPCERQYTRRFRAARLTPAWHPRMLVLEGVGDLEEGLAADANLEWYLTRLTTLSINAHRNTEATIGATTVAPYIETRFGGRIDHELLRNVILTAGVESGKREYQDGIDRTDDYTFADVGADYLLNRRVALRARLRHAEVNSSGADAYRDFEVNSLTLGIAFRL